MPLPPFTFQDPITDTTDVPTKPSSETELRQFLQGPSNELADLYTDYIKPLVDSLEKKAPKYVADTGNVNDYIIAPDPAYTALADLVGIPLYFKVKTTNTGASTLKVNGLSAVPIKKNVAQALAAGDLTINSIVQVIYDGTNFQLITMPMRIEYGLVSVAINNTPQAVTAVNFATPFNSAPIVLVVAQGTYDLFGIAEGVTVNGFNAGLVYKLGTNITVTKNAAWIAIGR